MAKQKILIIDDEQSIRESIEMVLEREDYDLHFAQNGKQGLEMIADIRPILVVLDLRMPEMSGLELLSNIDKNIINPDSIIVLSGHGTGKDIRECYSLGITNFISKPFNSYIFRGTVNNLITLLDYKNNLEKKVTEQTIELQKAVEKITELNDETYQFLRFLSHEMRTPLNWIQGGTVLMSMEDLGDFEKESVDIINKGFDQLLKLNDDFLEYMTFAKEKLDLKISTVSLFEIIKSIIQSKQTKLVDLQIKIENKVSDSFKIQADHIYLTNLLLIVIDNAIMFSNKGGIVSINAMDNNNKILLEICDSGKGIKQKYLDQIFKPFNVDNYDRQENGFGLNLPKAKIIADAHGWKFWAESAGENKGTKFILEI